MTLGTALVILAILVTAPFWVPAVIVLVVGVLAVIFFAGSMSIIIALEAIDHWRERAHMRRINRR